MKFNNSLLLLSHKSLSHCPPPLQTVIMNRTKCLQPSVLPIFPPGNLNFAHFTCNIHAMSEKEDSWSGHLKSPGNHWLSLVLMKENNSVTCAKTVQKQPFLMSDTSCPPDTFYVSNSLIKQHPRERDTSQPRVCAWRGEYACVCVCV